MAELAAMTPSRWPLRDKNAGSPANNKNGQCQDIYFRKQLKWRCGRRDV